jgi:hypothetical protein
MTAKLSSEGANIVALEQIDDCPELGLFTHDAFAHVVASRRASYLLGDTSDKGSGAANCLTNTVVAGSHPTLHGHALMRRADAFGRCMESFDGQQ